MSGLETYGVAELVRRRLPSALAELAELALDLRWTWSHAGDALWGGVDAGMWEDTRNPWLLLQTASVERLEKLAVDARFLDELQRLVEDRRTYLAAPPDPPIDATVAYFCMEFGLGAALPLYAGGLGILAGDYLKTASDLGLSAAGVGLLYQEGYFRQSIDAAGRQHETYAYIDPATLPIVPAQAADGKVVRVSIDLPGRKLWLRVWRARVGRVDLFLLDANDAANAPVDRGITATLYGGDAETRLLQEMVLGIGGLRALSAVGVAPAVLHLNEGHAAFAVLERARAFALEERTTFREALWATRAGTVFTTHTSVASAFDFFERDLMAKYFPSDGEFLAPLRISTDEVLRLGRLDPNDEAAPFAMPYLAFRGAALVNGVSDVHGTVSRQIFSALLPRWPEAEVPVSQVTNGVHVPSWDSAAADSLWTRACGKERWVGSVEALPEAVRCVPDDELWALRGEERHNLVTYARGRLRSQLARRGSPAATELGDVLDANVLTIGFARRFAEYKRPNLLLSDPDRLVRLLRDATHPVQLVIAGKAHPADERGKQLIADWIAFVNRPDVRGRAVFLEDYDMAVAEKLVEGVDVWLNTPRRPWEACGTSGMKVLVNGGLNLSALDGWWAEAFSKNCGWALDASTPDSDTEDARQLYALLEENVVPAFYDRDAAGIPQAWVKMIRASMAGLAPRFSSNRMLRQYVDRYYAPAARAFGDRAMDGAASARELARWSETLARHWPQIHFGDVQVDDTNDRPRLRASVYLGDVEPSSVRVEAYADARHQHGRAVVEMYPTEALTGATGGHVYEAVVPASRQSSDFTVRVIPAHAAAIIPNELPLISWQR